jgi:hypothetical protein
MSISLGQDAVLDRRVIISANVFYSLSSTQNFVIEFEYNKV